MSKENNTAAWIIVIILVLFFLFGGFGMMGGFRNMMGNIYWGGFGFMWLFVLLIWILIIIALVLGIIWLIRQLQKPAPSKRRR